MAEWLLNYELESMCKEAIVADFKVLSQDLSVCAEVRNEKCLVRNSNIQKPQCWRHLAQRWHFAAPCSAATFCGTLLSGDILSSESRVVFKWTLLLLLCVSEWKYTNKPKISKKLGSFFWLNPLNRSSYLMKQRVWHPNVYWTAHHCNSWRMKDQLDVTCYFISLLMCSTFFGQ